MSNAACDECQMIAEEISEAYSAIHLELSSNPDAKEAWLARNKLIGGTEQDAAQAEALFFKGGTKSSERVRLAIGMKFLHEARTGHKVPASAEIEE
jgi:hypothetical protein